MKNKNLFFLILTVLSSGLLFYLYIDYQSALAQGDHGRDLYAFAATLRGEVPYRDYWWVYGPLMPYYYGLFFKFLGINIPSILLGKLFLNLLAGVFFYLSLALMISPVFAYLGVLWFWTFQPDFFFTYNHAGGIAMLLAATYCLFAYIKTHRTAYLFAGLLSIFLLGLIKFNFGVMALVIFLSSVFMIDRAAPIPPTPAKRQFYIFALFIVPPILLFIYAALLYDLPNYEIRECFPYLKEDQQYYIPLFKGLSTWIKMILGNVVASWQNSLFGLLVIGSMLQTFNRLFSKTTDKKTKIQVILAIMVLCLFYSASLHEFIRSGVLYRSYWARPFSMLLIFLCIGFAIKNFPQMIKLAVGAFLVFLLGQYWIAQVPFVTQQKSPEQYLAHEKGKVFLGNSPAWIDTILKTTEYLQTHLGKDELFFALPYDPIYYYLTGKQSPTRQLIFFDHIHIPPEQELKIIAELEQKKVNYILLSNRMDSSEAGLGTFGVSYGKLLKEYIVNHFSQEATFGTWNQPAGWAWNHGTMILKRK